MKADAVYKINAPSGYQSETTGKVTPEQHEAICSIFADESLAAVVIAARDKKREQKS